MEAATPMPPKSAFHDDYARQQDSYGGYGLMNLNSYGDNGSTPFNNIVGKYTQSLASGGMPGAGSGGHDSFSTSHTLENLSSKHDNHSKPDRALTDGLKRLQDMVEKLGVGQEALGAMVEEGKKERVTDIQSLRTDVQSVRDTIAQQEALMK